MWVHRSGELYKDRPIVVYEYQKGRDHKIPLEFYKDYKGILVTDGLQQYHLVDKLLPDVINANCWAHARRDLTEAVKAADKKDSNSVRQSVAYQALQKIGEFYNLDTELKKLSSSERLQKRQEVIKPLVEEFFVWLKQQVLECAVPPKSKTAQGLNYIINQESYLKVFLTDGDIPIDNSASERSIRTFCVDVYAVRDLDSYEKSTGGSFDSIGTLVGLKEFSQDEFNARNIDSLRENASIAVTGNPLENSEIEKFVAEYEEFGITYDFTADQWYFNGEEVRYFWDVLISNGESLTSGKFNGELRTFI